MWERSATWLRSAQGTKTLAVVIACLLVSAVSSVGQVNAENRKAGSRDVASTGRLALPGDRSGAGSTSTTAGEGDPLDGAATTLPGMPRRGGPPTTFGNAPVPKHGLRTQGVTDKEVKVGVTYNVSGCGDSGALSAALGEAVTGDPERAFDAMERHVNDNGGINGRKFVLDIADDGSGGCPEKAAAAAVKLVDQDKVFLVIPGIHDVSDYSISKRIPTLIGREDDASLKAFGPNGIGLYAIQSALKVWASFAAHYLDSKSNVPCLIHPDDDEWNNNEKLLNALLTQYGIKFKEIVRYADDVSTAQRQASAAAAKFRDAGCNQAFFMAHNPIALIFFTSAATQSLWFPDAWTFTSYTALIDTPLAANLMDKRQWRNAVGMSYRVPPGQHPAEGNCKKIYEHYYPDDDTGGDAAYTQVACALVLPAAEMMRRGERLTGELTGDSFVLGADSISNDYFYDATVPLDWSIPHGGPYKTKAMDDWTVIKWNPDRGEYDFPEFPLYWKVMGANKSGGVDLRPTFKAAS
ncbi:MAG TPA: ABC transporter substrate-binding protein [Acidimicrobiales bacterium]|nr:ABC transporter substrate-binding protein [Acidimicrobiales bacterium]